jgi:hypothetical protein
VASLACLTACRALGMTVYRQREPRHDSNRLRVKHHQLRTILVTFAFIRYLSQKDLSRTRECKEPSKEVVQAPKRREV